MGPLFRCDSTKCPTHCKLHRTYCSETILLTSMATELGTADICAVSGLLEARVLLLERAKAVRLMRNANPRTNMQRRSRKVYLCLKYRGPEPCSLQSVLQLTSIGHTGVPRDSPLEGQSMWDFASITLGCAKRSLFYFILFYFISIGHNRSRCRRAPDGRYWCDIQLNAIVASTDRKCTSADRMRTVSRCQ